MPKKIFELANEIGKGALDLVEELKSHGFNVRNHMTVLDDEEVKKAIALCSGAPEESDSKKSKVTKKKVAKKKVTKKKVIKKVADSVDPDSGDVAITETIVSTTVDPDSEDASKTKIVRRKKAVVRKKAPAKSDEEVSEEEAVEVEASAEVDVDIDTDSDVDTGSTDADTETEEIVAAADDSEDEVKEEKKANSGQSPEQLLNTKQFGLRIVKQAPVKPKVEARDEDEDDRPRKKIITKPVADEDIVDDDEVARGKDGATSKKRLSGLASMMSGKKAIVNRSQTLNEERATSELKSYGVLSGGRPMYTMIKRKKSYSGPAKTTAITEVKDSKRVVKLHGGALVEELAKKLSVKLKDMIDQCLDLNLLIKAGDYVGMKLATDIAALYDYRVENVAFDEDKIIGKDKKEDRSHLPLRSPIITIMGHVDHGKTTLLDYIRNEKVASGEAGGITQHIGAYSVDVKGSSLTFLDTPGHAAFAAMRQRGADVTDIVVLIVAADDGVMPQTRESIKFIQNAGKPLIVAVNKMDKEGANPDRVKQELTEFNITPEEWGGDTQFCPVSALKGDGVDDLLEAIALQAEIMDLREDPNGSAEGIVIESKIEQGRGPVATILVQSGTLKKGDAIVVGETYGRARSLTNYRGTLLDSAGPSIPVQVLGLTEAPSPGDTLNVVKNEREAKKIAENRIDERKKLDSVGATAPKVSLEDFFAAAKDEGPEQKELALIIRSDVQGSFEAIKNAVEGLSNPEVNVRVIAGGVGPISDSDVAMAETSGGFLLGFNMRPSTSARKMAEVKGIDVKTYSIIYELINDVKLAIEGLLVPETVEEFIGRAEVRDTFSVPKIGTIAGSYVIDGSIQSGCNVRLLRDGKIVFDGKMSSLKRFKDDVKEVKNGYECGIALEQYTDIKVGDLFEAYRLIEKKRTLSDVETQGTIL
ncbi:translation initiation factor IF-2 [Bacteriovorax sp. Seq25_V]|uniref:translation initiation factor IF-2 n=1 Tax=Bacteriovorax sp. Seq25_V TaxID=1201288 RepID=UPI00038A4995|nr:translation initiation factor IF-2 [Bacteriovorax sp. Seq25_V]EQC44312.1 translation initiation factor IF-2 [Bacteriovorax sp. Seq25_V]